MLSLRFGPNFPNILHIFVFMFGLLVYIFLSFISAFCFSLFFFFPPLWFREAGRYKTAFALASETGNI